MKKYALFVIISFVCIMGLIGGTVYIVDPYFHYHAPFKGIYYKLGNYVYQNDGISKNFDYDAIITGTSMTKDFSTKDIDEMWGVNSVRLTFLGEGYRRINDNLVTAFNHNKDIKLVIRGVDPIWFVSDESFLEYGSYEEYPTYLYDDNILNDTKYLFNFGIIKNDVFPRIKDSIKHLPYGESKPKDLNYRGGKELVLEAYERPEKSNKAVTEEETKQLFDTLDKNLEMNVLKVIRDHPDTKFILFFPPYEIPIWDSINQEGKDVLQRRIDMERYAIEKCLELDNVEFYSFNDCFDITSDMNYYVDDLHYVPYVSHYMLECMSSGDEHRLTKDNYLEYIDRIREYYTTYDYDSFFEE